MQFSEKQIKVKPLGFTIVVLSVMLFTVCILYYEHHINSQVHNPNVIIQDDYKSLFAVTRTDLNTDSSNAVNIELSEHSNEYVITDSGDYILTGTLNGNICINAEEQIVHIILHNASIRSSSGPAFHIKSAGKVTITVDTDTENTLTDSGTYPESGEENACIFSVCDLTLNGTGILNIQGYYKDGIHSKDVVKIMGGKITVQSKRDGIRGNDGILVNTDKLNIESEGSGLHTTKTGSNTKGMIEISGGNLSIISGKYAIDSAGGLYTADCDIYEKGILSNRNISENSVIQEELPENE